jgi:hypothetical protein
MLANAQATTKGAIMLLTNFVFISVISFSCFGLPRLLVIENSVLAVHRRTSQNFAVRYAESAEDLRTTGSADVTASGEKSDYPVLFQSNQPPRWCCVTAVAKCGS